MQLFNANNNAKSLEQELTWLEKILQKRAEYAQNNTLIEDSFLLNSPPPLLSNTSNYANLCEDLAKKTQEIHKKEFSEAELYFLSLANVFPNENNEIEGKEVFDLYINLIENKNPDFVSQKVHLKKMQSILTKFVFSIFDDPQGKTKRKLICFADIDKKQVKFNNNDNNKETDAKTYGFVYLQGYKQVYDEKYGLDNTKFEDTDNFIL
jgi:hypothetical protein